jgi:hypothetical protein
MGSTDVCHQDVFLDWTHLVTFEQEKKHRPGSRCDGLRPSGHLDCRAT